MKRNIVMGLTFLLFILIVGSYSIYFSAQKPMVRAEKEATAIAEEVAGIEKVDRFYWYNGATETYFTVGGYTGEQEYLYVVIKQDGGQVATFNAKEVVTEDDAKSILQAAKNPAEILEARMGIEEEEPFWEVSYLDQDGHLGYFTISARTGETLNEFTNI